MFGARIARNVLKCKFTKHIGVTAQRKAQQNRMASAMKEKGESMEHKDGLFEWICAIIILILFFVVPLFFEPITY